MRRCVKYWALSISSVLFLLVFTLSLLPTLVNLEKYSSVVESHLSSLTGRSVKLGKDMTMSFFPWFGLSVSDVMIANRDGFQAQYFAKFKTFEARLKLFPLLLGRLSFTRFVIDGLELNLEKNREGRVNWNFSTRQRLNGSPDEQEKDILWRLPASVSLFAITDGAIHYRNLVTGSQNDIEELMVLSPTNSGGRSTIEGSGVFDGKHLALEGSFSSVAEGIGYGVENIVMELTAFDEVVAQITGSVKDLLADPDYDLKISLPEFSPETFLSFSKSPFFFANKGLTDIQDLAITAAVKGDLQKVTVEDGYASFDKSNIKFSFSYDKSEPPWLQFNLDIDFIRLDDYLPEKGFQAIGQNEAATSSKFPQIDVIFEPGTQISGLLEFEEVKVGMLSFKNGRAVIASDDGKKILCDPVTFNLYGGSADAEVMIDNSEETSNSIVTVQAEEVGVESFSQDFLGFSFLSGTLSGTLGLDITGADRENMMGKLKGQGAIHLQEGEIFGSGDENILSSEATGRSGGDSGQAGKAIKYSEIISEITIDEGLLETSGSLLKAETLDLYLSGRMNLRNKDFSLQIDGLQPGPEKVEKGGDNAGRKVTVSGSLHKPNQILISRQQSTAKLLQSPNSIDVNFLVEEKMPSPQDEDVKNLEGKALIDPAIVAQRFRLQSEVPSPKKDQRSPSGSGKISINPLIIKTSFK